MTHDSSPQPDARQRAENTLRAQGWTDADFEDYNAWLTQIDAEYRDRNEDRDYAIWSASR